jgi:hypothetical protein
MTEEDRNAIAEIVGAAEQRIVTATTANLSDLRGELTRRLDTIERRTERMETNLHALLL